MRVSYTAVREIVVVSMIWEIASVLPRWLGILHIKPEAVGIIQTVDSVVGITLLLAIAYSCAAIIHNANIEYQKDKAAKK